MKPGPFYLRQQALADMVVEAIHYNATVLGNYLLDKLRRGLLEVLAPWWLT
jgi:hypothetical protein